MLCKVIIKYLFSSILRANSMSLFLVDWTEAYLEKSDGLP